MPSQTILVVDDDAAVLEFSCSVLSQYGYHVLGAASGQEALQVYSKGDRFDMALVDVMMPGMTGIELAKRLEALESGVKVALTSGHSPDEVARLIGEDGSSYRIFWKPYDLRIFLQMIRNVLDTPQRVTVAFARS
jgi:CheY-like chemotaxis protein